MNKKTINTLFKFLCMFFIGYLCFNFYFMFSKPYTIVLDPGHGGSDVGAEGYILESELNQKTTQYLYELLNQEGRFRVILSKDYDDDMSVTERNKVMQRLKPDIMLSIHANASENPQSYGFECFPSPPNTDNYNESVILASLIANEMNNIGARLRGNDGVRYAYYAPVENEENVYEKLIVESNDTFLYNYDTFGVLMDMDCPSVLVEQCFVTNASDVEMFATDEGAKNVAEAYYNAVIKYINSLED